MAAPLDPDEADRVTESILDDVVVWAQIINAGQLPQMPPIAMPGTPISE